MSESKADEARRVARDATRGDGAQLPWSFSWQANTRDPPHGDVRDAEGGHVAMVCDVPCSELIVFAVNNLESLADEIVALRAELASKDARIRELRALADKWDRQQAIYPTSTAGDTAAATVRCCIRELRAALSARETEGE